MKRARRVILALAVTALLVGPVAARGNIRDGSVRERRECVAMARAEHKECRDGQGPLIRRFCNIIFDLERLLCRLTH